MHFLVIKGILDIFNYYTDNFNIPYYIFGKNQSNYQLSICKKRMVKKHLLLLCINEPLLHCTNFMIIMLTKIERQSFAFVQMAIPGLQFFDESRDKDSITTQIVLFCVAGRDDIIF